MAEALLHITLTDVVDVLVVGLLLWGLLVWARRVGANLALLGLAVLVGMYAVALQLGLQLTIWIFRGFFAGLVVLLAVIFQEDVRRLFEQIAAFGLRRHRQQPAVSSAATIYRALTEMSRRRTGALVVIYGRELVERQVTGGVRLDARLSEELLLSLFDPHSPGHDGALLVMGDRATRFAVHLPLSADREQLGSRGTRHAAALGLAERTDALAVVVSEERGTISVARAGQLRELSDPTELIDELRYQLHLSTRRRPDRARARTRWRRLAEAVVAFVIALAGWFAFVPGAAWEQADHEVAVRAEYVPAGYRVTGLAPPAVRVTVAGPRRRLVLTRTNDFEVVVDASLVGQGRRTFAIDPNSVRHQTQLEIVRVQPDIVVLSVETEPGSEGAAPGG